MILQQSFQGDPPNVGFHENRLTSPGFPNEPSWMDDIAVSRVNKCVPNVMGPDGLQVSNVVYELQSATYGQLCAISSAHAYEVQRGALQGREHAFTHIVAFMADRGKTAADHWHPEKLMGFDQFFTPQLFWQMHVLPELKPLEWVPAKHPDPKGGVMDDMHRALLIRYWKAITNRAFYPEAPLNPLQVYVAGDPPGQEKGLSSDFPDYEWAIQAGKLLLGHNIAPYLPPSAWNILSMTAGVLPDQVRAFAPTAMAIMVSVESGAPENAQVFDLAGRQYQPLNEMEKAFAQTIVGTPILPELEQMAQVLIQKKLKETLPQCTFLADYSVAFIAWRLQNRRYENVQEAVALYRALYEKLRDVHLIQNEVVLNEMLRPLERELFQEKNFARNENIREEDIGFLFQRATETEESVSEVQGDILADTQEKNPSSLTFLEEMPIEPGQAKRVAEVLKKLLPKAFKEKGLPDNIRNALADIRVVEQFTKFQAIKQVMTDFLNQYLDIQKRQALQMINLSKHYLSGIQQLKHVLNHLLNTSVDILPGEGVLNIVRENLSHLDEENKELLRDYCLQVYDRHQDAPEKVKSLVKGIGADTTDALLAGIRQLFADDGLPDPKALQQLLSVFATAAKEDVIHGELLEQMEARLQALPLNRDTNVPVVDEAPAVSTVDAAGSPMGEASEVVPDAQSMHSPGTAAAAQTLRDAFDWGTALTELPHAPQEKMQEKLFTHVHRWAKTAPPFLTNQQLELLWDWKEKEKAGLTSEDGESQLRLVMERHMPGCRDVVADRLGAIAPLADSPNLRSFLLELCQQNLIRRWGEGEGYWDVIHDVQQQAAHGPITAQELVRQEEVTDAAKQLLNDYMGGRDTLAFFQQAQETLETERDRSQSGDGQAAFIDPWKTQLHGALKGKVNQLYGKCTSEKDMDQLIALLKTDVQLWRDVQSEPVIRSHQVFEKARHLLDNLMDNWGKPVSSQQSTAVDYAGTRPTGMDHADASPTPMHQTGPATLEGAYKQTREVINDIQQDLKAEPRSAGCEVIIQRIRERIDAQWLKRPVDYPALMARLLYAWTDKNGFNAGQFLKGMEKWNVKNPWDNSNRDQLLSLMAAFQFLADGHEECGNLFSSLEAVHHEADLLLETLRKDKDKKYDSYRKKVRANKKMMNDLMIGMNKADNGLNHFYRWLTGT